MKPTHARKYLAIAAMAALPALFSAPAQAQYRVGDDGHALDANNRIGSGGYNRQRDLPYRVSGNQIVTGNVTGGREFRGPTGYTDPQAFRGPTAGGSSDRFIRDSSGAPTSYAPDVDITRPTPFYGSSRAAPPPPGYVADGTTGAYIPSPQVSNRAIGDQRLGLVNNTPPINVDPRPGELLLPGPVDANTQSSTFLSASPLYGVRQWNIDDPSDRYFLSTYTNIAAPRSSNVLSDSTIQRYRNELIDAATPAEQNQSSQGAQQGTGAPNQSSNPNQPQPLVNAQRLNSPSVNDRSAPGQFTNPNYTGASSDTVQGQRNRLLVPPEQQSSQYAELHRRLERSNQDRQLNDAEANRQFQELRRAQQQGQSGDSGENPYLKSPKPPTPQTNQPQTPEGTVQPAPTEPKKPDESKAVHPVPMPIESLAKGVGAEGLSNLLKQAESLMAEGKFAAALDQYDAAQQVAPNNPLILLGRANAELGAGFYTRSEGHIRDAILTDPAVLVGQYDLQKFLGQERLQAVTTELKQIAQSEQQQATPVFLLAWIAYNTGSPRQAASYLDLAEKRVGRPDAIYRVMREIWQLPAADAPASPQPEKPNK